MKRFTEKIKKTNSCWIWTSGIRGRYGRFWFGNKSIPAHRFAYELWKSPIPEGMIICHKCDNPVCVRPSHLFIGTNKENSIDMIRKGRGKNQFKGCEKHPNRKLTASQITKIRKLVGDGKLTQLQAGRKFNVGQSAISRIVNNKRWSDLTVLTGG